MKKIILIVIVIVSMANHSYPAAKSVNLNRDRMSKYEQITEKLLNADF